MAKNPKEYKGNNPITKILLDKGSFSMPTYKIVVFPNVQSGTSDCTVDADVNEQIYEQLKNPATVVEVLDEHGVLDTKCEDHEVLSQVSSTSATRLQVYFTTKGQKGPRKLKLTKHDTTVETEDGVTFNL